MKRGHEPSTLPQSSSAVLASIDWSQLNSAMVQVKCQNSMHKIRAICKSDHSCSMKIKIERCISIDQYSAKYMLLISRPPWVDYIVVAAALLLWLCHLNN